MEQERKFTLAEFIATVQEDRSIQLPQQLLEVLGITPGQAIHFEIDNEGRVTVKPYKPPKDNTGAVSTTDPINSKQVEQAFLFGTQDSTTEPGTRHANRRQKS